MCHCHMRHVSLPTLSSYSSHSATCLATHLGIPNTLLLQLCQFFLHRRSGSHISRTHHIPASFSILHRPPFSTTFSVSFEYVLYGYGCQPFPSADILFFCLFLPPLFSKITRKVIYLILFVHKFCRQKLYQCQSLVLERTHKQVGIKEGNKKNDFLVIT